MEGTTRTDLITDVIYNASCIEGMKLLPNECIDLILTDPPYNSGMVSNSQSTWLTGMFNDSYSEFRYELLVKRVCEQLYRLLKNNKCGYIFINYRSLNIWINELESKGFSVKNVLVCPKQVHGLNYQNYAYTYELCIYFIKGQFTPNNKIDYNKGYWKDVWHIQRKIDTSQEEGHHETMKPLDILRVILSHGSKENDIIIDPFMGSGSTAVACKQMNRRYIGFEVEEKYFKICNERLAQQSLNNPVINTEHQKEVGTWSIKQ